MSATTRKPAPAAAAAAAAAAAHVLERPLSLSSLPDEVLNQILASVARISMRTMTSISLVSRRFHALADAALYESVRFSTPELQLLFSESLRRRPRRGSVIREVQLAYPSPGSALSDSMLEARVHGSYYERFDSLSRTISMMSNLEALDVAVPVALLPGIGKLFDGPFDLAYLKTCSLFYQVEKEGEFWDLQENIHIFSHPSLESLTVRGAKLDPRGFDFIEQPHETALTKLRLIDCDINDDALSDILMFPRALEEFVLTQERDAAELDESSDRFEEYMLALKSASHSLRSITVDFPSLAGPRVLRMRDFEELTALRMNWDYQLFGKSSSKPRLHSVGIPEKLKVLEFLNPMGMDEEVTDLLVLAVQNIKYTAPNLTSIVVNQGDESAVPRAVVEACKTAGLRLDVIGSFDQDEEDEDGGVSLKGDEGAE